MPFLQDILEIKRRRKRKKERIQFWNTTLQRRVSSSITLIAKERRRRRIMLNAIKYQKVIQLHCQLTMIHRKMVIIELLRMRKKKIMGRNNDKIYCAKRVTLPLSPHHRDYKLYTILRTGYYYYIFIFCSF